MKHTEPAGPALSRRSVLRRTTLASVAGLAGVTGLSASAAAQSCDAVVPDDYASIQAAVDDADAGDTICIEPGTYEETVRADEEVTLRGRTAPNGGNPATVDGYVSVEADGVTIRRLRITASETFDGGTFPDPFGVRVTAGDVLVEDNLVEGFRADLGDGAGSFTVHGVQVFGASGAGASDVTVRGNQIRDVRSDGGDEWPEYGGVAGVKIQAGADGATVTDNEITDLHSAGWAYGVVLATSASAPGAPTDVTVEDNDVSELNDGTEFDVFTGADDGRSAAPYPGSAVAVDTGADATEATVRHNNLLAPNGVETKDDDGTLEATCNWWGDRSGPTDDDNPDGTGTWALERGDASADYTPWLNAPSPARSCVGGQTNGNGASGNGNGNNGNGKANGNNGNGKATGASGNGKANGANGNNGNNGKANGASGRGRGP
ncbi:hypothetical protein [Halobacterium yunchengense]|uniref:hypothetical protein n=1 Tax=Halobacterium yunchengense TaxID=3108497 RepID=UPI0030086D76